MKTPGATRLVFVHTGVCSQATLISTLSQNRKEAVERRMIIEDV